MAISISDVTSNLTTTDGVVTGDGAFDDLMEAVNTQLKNQFDLGRITGTDYANVYLGAMQFAIQNAVQFTLGEQNANKQAALIDKQATTEEKKALDVVSSTTVRNTQSTNDTALKTAQTTLTTNQGATELKKALDVVSTTSVRDTQSGNDTLLKTAQITLANNQADTELKQALNISANTVKIEADIIDKTLATKAELRISEQKLISEKITNGEEINQYIWEIEYAEDPDNTYTFTTIQNLTENDVISLRNFDPHVAGYTVQSVVLNQVTNIRTAGTSLAEVSIQKAEGEVAVLAQKEITEYAQTEKTDKSAPTTTSIMGRQSSLYERQANGFEWDAKNTHNKNKVDYEKALVLNDGVITPGFTITDPTS